MTATTNVSYSAMKRAALLGELHNYVLPLDELRDWQIDAMRRIAVLRGLPQNWNSYGSVPVSAESIEQAAGVVARQIFPETLGAPRIFPVAGGGVQLTWNVEDREVQLEVNAERGCELVLLRNDDAVAETSERRALTSLPLARVIQWLAIGQ